MKTSLFKRAKAFFVTFYFKMLWGPILNCVKPFDFTESQLE